MDNQAQIPDLAELKRLADACPPAGNHHFESGEWKTVTAFRDEVVRLFGCDVGMAKALTSEIQEMRKDAERYRWLREFGFKREIIGSEDQAPGRGPFIQVNLPSVGVLQTVAIWNESADNAIDEAMNEGKQP